uniref:ELM2 domain-containing protein n=1 Tax=Strongyloides stercoralis TaxID=6248 RepID=A0AAF5DGK3_STRER
MANKRKHSDEPPLKKQKVSKKETALSTLSNEESERMHQNPVDETLNAVENGLSGNNDVENGSSTNNDVENGSSTNNDVENGSSTNNDVENGSSTNNDVENDLGNNNVIENDVSNNNDVINELPDNNVVEDELPNNNAIENELPNDSVVENELPSGNAVNKLNIGLQYQAVIPECKPREKIQKTSEILIWDCKQNNADKWSLEKQRIVHKFAKAVEDYGYEYLEALSILQQYNYDPIESSKHVEAYIPHHSFERFTNDEELLFNDCRRKIGRSKKKEVFQQMVCESTRTHKEIVEQYYKTKKHPCLKGRCKCYCKKKSFIKRKRNIIERQDCENCRDCLYLRNDIDLEIYRNNDNLPLCSLCKFYFNETNKMRIPSVKFDPLKNNYDEENQKHYGMVEQINIPESHIFLILNELKANSLDIKRTLERLKEDHGVSGYSESHIRWFINTQARKYNINFNNFLAKEKTIGNGNLEVKEKKK